MSEIITHKISVLSELFDREKVFVVPHFQRSYTWDKDLISELWEDLCNIVLDDQTSTEHFMGAFIFADEESSTERHGGIPRELIIDGQQRMISLTILFRALFDSLEKDSDLSGHILDLIIGGRFDETPYPRLELGEDVEEFFQKYIQEENTNEYRSSRKGKRKVQKRIIQAYQFFIDAIKFESEKRKMDRQRFVEYIFRKLKEKLIAVRIKVHSDADAYAIFETINSKKVELSVSELLKNYIFLQSNKISSTALSRARKKWNEIIENLNQEDEIETSQFIRHYWISNIENVSEKNLYRAIKSRYNNNRKAVEQYINHLTEESALYAKLIYASRDENDENIDQVGVDLLSQIKSLRIKQCYPMLLSALSTGLYKEQFNDLSKAIIKVSLMRSLADLNPNELEDVYMRGARALRSRNKTVVKEIMDEIEEYIPKEADIRSTVMENEVSEQLARFILTRYELSKKTGETELSKTSLEHILPQNPEDVSQWNMTKEEHESYVGRLGNLTLVGQKLNQKASNRPFVEKGKILGKSEIISTAEIIKKYKRWGKTEIQERTKELLDFIFSNWD